MLEVILRQLAAALCGRLPVAAGAQNRRLQSVFRMTGIAKLEESFRHPR
jgi:hypothetical protein